MPDSNGVADSVTVFQVQIVAVVGVEKVVILDDVGNDDTTVLASNNVPIDVEGVSIRISLVLAVPI